MTRNDHERSRGWRFGGQVGRLRWGLQVWCHHAPHIDSDRWVWQPSLVWDRRKGTAYIGRSGGSNG